MPKKAVSKKATKTAVAAAVVAEASVPTTVAVETIIPAPVVSTPTADVVAPAKRKRATSKRVTNADAKKVAATTPGTGCNEGACGTPTFEQKPPELERMTPEDEGEADRLETKSSKTAAGTTETVVEKVAAKKRRSFEHAVELLDEYYKDTPARDIRHYHDED
jgi:hypothetical protein